MAATITAATAAGVAQAQDKPVAPILGIRLGAALDQFPLCPKRGGATTWCRRSSNVATAVKAPDQGDALPSWVKVDREYPDLYRLLSGGKIVEFRVNTTGPQVQDTVIRAISGRFGKPAVYELQTKQNSFGAKIDSAFVVWNTPEVGVVHNCTKFDECTLIFQRGEDFRRDLEKRRKQQQRDERL